MKILVTTLANNQTIIEERETGKKEFYSYDSLIATIHKNTITLDQKLWKCSRTTTKYLCQFLGYRSKKNIEEAINNGLFKLSNLNLKSEAIKEANNH
jgi:hypothetical protein